MRDFETISVAITAAETGHLVLSTLHTIGAASTESGYLMPLDRDGRRRDDEPDMGCYEFYEEGKE